MPLDYFKSLPYGKDYLKYIEINHDDLNSSKNRTNDWDKSSIIDFNINKNTDSSLDKDNNNSINNSMSINENKNTNYSNVRKTQFHNINQSCLNYSPDELKEIIKESQKRKFKK